MKYSTPGVRYTGSAIAAVRQQTQATKFSPFLDRPDLLVFGQLNAVAVSPAYEADE